MAKRIVPGIGGHETVKLKSPFAKGDSAFDIDVNLAPLISELWRLGIDTCQCCEEDRPGMAQIEFPGTREACEFLYVAQRDYHTELERWDEGEGGEYSIRLRLVVYFPAVEIPRLAAAFAVVKEL